MPDMTGRPGCRTMEMFGGSTASYLARTPRIPLFVLIFIGLETKNVLDYQGRAGSTSIVQWTLRPVIFGVDPKVVHNSEINLGRESPLFSRVSGSPTVRNLEIQNLLWERFRGVSGFVPDFTPEMLNRTRGISKFLRPPKVVLESTLCSTFFPPPPPNSRDTFCPPPQLLSKVFWRRGLFNQGRPILSGPLRLRVQSRLRTGLWIAVSIAFLLRACFKGILDTIAPLSRGWAPKAV